jgi:hypothetical protein
MGMRSCSSLRKTARWANPLAPPPARTTTTDGDFTGSAVSGWATTPQLNNQVLNNNNSRWIFALLYNMPVTFKNKNLMLGYFIDSIQRNTFKRRCSLGHDHFQWHVDASVLSLPSAKRPSRRGRHRQQATRWTKQPIHRTRPVATHVSGLHSHRQNQRHDKYNEFSILDIFNVFIMPNKT